MFFSVKKEIRIGGKVYVPCVCYSLPQFLEYTVNKLVEEGKAVIYDEYVGFMNGKVLVKEKPSKKASRKASKKEVKKEAEVKEETVETEVKEEVSDVAETF